MMPARVAAARRNDKEFLEFGKWHRIMARLVGQHAVRDFRSHKKASGASSRKCFNETELKHVLKAGWKSPLPGHVVIYRAGLRNFDRIHCRDSRSLRD